MDDDPEWKKPKHKKHWVRKKRSKEHRDKALRFLWAGIAGFGATLWVQPLALIKIRMQMTAARVKRTQRPTALEEFNCILRTCGAVCLYRGISANLVRQLVYTSTRLGIYYMLRDMALEKNKSIPFLRKCWYGLIAGAVAGFLSVPSEIAFVRMIADEKLEFRIRRNYLHVGDAFKSIVKNEGVLALWKGGFPTICRGMVTNASSMGIYSEMKEKLKDHHMFERDKKDRLLTACSSIISSVVTSFLIGPIDLIKTRMQTSYYLVVAREYNGTFDCFKKIVREEGFFSLWRGFTPAIMQNIPFTFFLFLTYEEFNRIYSQH